MYLFPQWNNYRHRLHNDVDGHAVLRLAIFEKDERTAIYRTLEVSDGAYRPMPWKFGGEAALLRSTLLLEGIRVMLGRCWSRRLALAEVRLSVHFGNWHGGCRPSDLYSKVS